MNKVILSGRIANERVEAFNYGNNQMGYRFVIAAKDNKNYDTSFIKVACFNSKIGQNAQKYLVKGDYVEVEGRIKNNEKSFVNEKGIEEKQYFLNIVVDEITFGPKSQKHNEADNNAYVADIAIDDYPL